MDRPENINIQYVQVSQLVDTFKSQQHDRLDDDKLFYGHLKKCRCCFMQLTEIRGANIIHQWHRETFMAMTGLELSSESHHSNYLCLNCIELLKIFTQLKVAADGMQKVQNRYIEHHRQPFEVVTVKQEVEDEIVAETQVNDTNNQTEDENIIEKIKLEEINHDEIATNREDGSEVLAKMINGMTECSVQLERLDPMIIAQYSSSKRATVTDADTTTFLIDHTYSSPLVHFFSCDLCGYETDSKEFLTHHIDSRHKQQERKQIENEFKCPIDGCNKSFKNKNSLRQHRYQVHKRDSQEETTCNQCEKVCKNKAALRHHQRIHIRKFACKICDKSFTQKFQLIDHMETYHISNSKFNCTNCSKVFKSQHKLKYHQRLTHDAKEFKCDQCNAEFRVPRHLVDHVQVKHKGKRFQCSHPGCLQNFTTKGHATTHLRVVHKLKDDELKNCCKNIKIF